MNNYVTGSTIRQLRDAKHLTQAQLAAALSVSAKTISKWETAKGLPDISLLEPLAAALGLSSTGTVPPISCAPNSMSAPSAATCSTPPGRPWSAAVAWPCPRRISPTPRTPTSTTS